MRYIRQVPAGGRVAPVSSIDDVQDPQLLAHSILHLNGERQENKYPPYLRMSMMHDVCVRERVLGYRTGALFTKVTNAQMQFTFDLGHAIHHFLQNSNKYFGQSRFGWWMCQACGYKYFGRYPQASCKECKAPPRAIQYVEHSIKMTDPFRATGHVDAFLEVAPGDIRVTDFKTINGDDFEKLTQPKGDHVVQVSGYMMLMGHDTTLPVKLNPTKGLVVYLSKKHTVKSLPIKVFHVHRNPVTDKYITDTLQLFTDAIRDSSIIPPKHPQCEQTRWGCYRGKNCAVLPECQRCG